MITNYKMETANGNDKYKKIKVYLAKEGRLEEKPVKRKVSVHLDAKDREVVGETCYGASVDGFAEYGECQIPYRQTSRTSFPYYLWLEDGKAVGISEKCVSIWWLLFGILFIVCLVSCLLWWFVTPQAPQQAGNIQIGNYTPIGEYQQMEEEVPKSNEMAYISGSSTVTISEKRRYVELKNLPQNENYLFSYQVKMGEDLLFETDSLIPAGQEALWDAYECEFITVGENTVDYQIDIYNYAGSKVSSAVVEGVLIIKN